MMRLGVVSDTHKHIVNLSKAIDFLKNQDTSMFIHLGDDYADPDVTAERNFIRVPGVFSDVYKNVKVPNRIIKNVVGWRLLLTHTLSSHPNDLPDDLKPEDIIREKRADIVLYGHTHLPETRQEEGIILVNPGHLKNEDKRGFPPTFAFVELTINRVVVRIYRLTDYEIFAEDTFLR